jgi:hypothetical protein
VKKPRCKKNEKKRDRNNVVLGRERDVLENKNDN